MKRLLRTALVGFAALATAAGGLAAATPASAAVAAQAIEWERCEDPDLRKAGAQCGMVTVPLDYGNPDGPKIKIAVSQRKATARAASRQGVLLAGSMFFPLAEISKRVDAEYDFVGFDRRGTGESRPLLDCGSDPIQARQPAYEPVADSGDEPGANERAWLGRWDKFQDGCAKKYGDALDHYHSMNVARDLDRIRAALGVERISFISTDDYFSAYVGESYSSLFPQRVRRMVIDSPASSERPGYADLLANTAGQERHVRQFWEWVAVRDSVYGLGDDGDEVEALFRAIEANLTERPRGRFGPAEWSDNIPLTVAFQEEAWPDVASVFAKWVRGNRKPLLEHYAEPDPEASAQFGGFAHQCADGDWPSDYDTYRDDASDLDTVLDWSDALFFAGCAGWPAKQGQLEVEGADEPSMLLVAAEGDTLTYPAALHLREIFPRAVLTAVEDSITLPAFSGNECVDRTIKRYLRDGVLPTRDSDDDSADKTCAPAKEPKPAKSDVKAAKKGADDRTRDRADALRDGDRADRDDNGADDRGGLRLGNLLGGLTGGGDDSKGEGDDSGDGIVIAGLGLGEGLNVGGGGGDDAVLPAAAGYRRSERAHRARAGRRRPE